jgi:hypothetical protein
METTVANSSAFHFWHTPREAMYERTGYRWCRERSATSYRLESLGDNRTPPCRRRECGMRCGTPVVAQLCVKWLPRNAFLMSLRWSFKNGRDMLMRLAQPPKFFRSFGAVNVAQLFDAPAMARWVTSRGAFVGWALLMNPLSWNGAAVDSEQEDFGTAWARCSYHSLA